MAQLTKSIIINAPLAQVWNTMLDRPSFEQRTSVFSVWSTYIGWRNQGNYIKFIDVTGQGMTSQIVENRKHKYISIKHFWDIMNNSSWDIQTKSYDSPMYENYSFTEAHDATTLTITMEWIPNEYLHMMDMTWPLALEQLKLICETNEV